MGKASISVAITALWDGSSQIDKAISDFKRLDRLVSQQNSSLSQGLASSGREWQEWGEKVHGIGTKIANLGDTLSRAVTVPAIALGSYGVKAAIDFDTALANLRKTSDLTDQQLESMAQSALEMSTTQPVDAQTILNVEALGAQLGISNNKLESFANTVTGLDIATNMDADTAATEMARFANIVGMSEDKFQNYGSTLVAIGNNMATTESEVSSMAQRFASAGKQAGLSEAEILGLSAAMSSLGIKAEMGGSALSQIFVSISKSVASGGDSLEAFAAAAGMSAEQFASAWKTNAAGAFESLLQGIHNASEAGTDMNTVLGNLGITQIRQSDVMRRLAGSVGDVSAALDLSTSAWEQNTALQTEVDQRNESLASRLQVLKNKVDEVAITVGRPLADALISALEAADPLIQAIANAADSFANMSEAGQQNVLMLAGIVTAAGPVLSVFGRLVQGFGSFATVFGKVQSAVAVYKDALGTLDGAHMRVYNATDKLSTNMGLMGNRAAQAAGSVEEYVSKWEGMYDAAKRAAASEEKLSAAQSQLDAINRQTKSSTDGVSKALEKKRAALEDSVAALQLENDAAAKSFVANGRAVSAYGNSTKEAQKYASGIKSLEGSMKSIEGTYKSVGVSASGMGTTMVNVGKAVVSSIGNMVAEAALMGGITIAISAVTSVVGSLVTKWQEAEEHSRLLAEATMSASDIMNGAKAGAEGLGTSMSTLTADVDGVLQKMASLNQSVQENFVAVEQNKAKLDQYTQTIADLANHSGLTATEQYRLQEAVAGYNEIVGDSISVTDAANGKLTDANGAIIENTDTLNDNAQAWYNRAKAQAYSNVATQYLEAEVEAAYNLKVAQEELAKVQEESKGAQEALTKARAEYTAHLGTRDEELYGQKLTETEDAANAYEDKIKELTEQISDLEDAHNSAAEKVSYFGESASLAAAGLSDEIVTALTGLPQDMQAMGVSVADSLAAGIQSGTVSTDAALSFVQQGIVSSVQGMSAEVRPYGLLVAQRLADGIADGSVSVEQANAVLAQVAQSGSIQDLPAIYSSVGFQMPQELADAINAASGLPEASVSEMTSLVALKLSDGNMEQAAEMCGGQIDQGLADAIANGTLSEEQAAYLGQDVVNRLKESVSGSGEAAQAGAEMDNQVAEGIESNSQAPANAAEDMRNSMLGPLGQMLLDFFTGGSQASANMASGMATGQANVAANAGALASSATAPVAQLSPTMLAAGSAAGSSFAYGIGSAAGSAMANGASLSSSASSGTSGASARLLANGSLAGANFAAGIGSGVGAALANATRLSSNADSGVSAANGKLLMRGQKSGASFASGVGSGVVATRLSAGRLASAAASMNTGNSFTWGSHLASNFASGIRAGYGWVASAARSIANAARSVLQFSVPKDGPWSGAERGGERSGLHLAQNWARGIDSGVPLVQAASSRLALAASQPMGSVQPVAPAMSAQTSDGQRTVVNTYNLTIDATRAASSSTRAQELIAALVGELVGTSDMGVQNG